METGTEGSAAASSGTASTWLKTGSGAIACAIGGGTPRNAATSRSSWKTRAVTVASCASSRRARSSPGDISALSLMSLHSTQAPRTEQ